MFYVDPPLKNICLARWDFTSSQDVDLLPFLKVHNVNTNNMKRAVSWMRHCYYLWQTICTEWWVLRLRTFNSVCAAFSLISNNRPTAFIHLSSSQMKKLSFLCHFCLRVQREVEISKWKYYWKLSKNGCEWTVLSVLCHGYSSFLSWTLFCQIWQYWVD